MKRIILTGGGTAGHVTPNIALVPKLKEKGYDIQYIGSYDGIERKLIEDLKIPYYGIASGKLRRYFDIKNFSDPFRVIKGYGQAIRLMKKLKPSVVFSKGGFVAVPVVMAAKHCHIPVVIHESDLTPGLANKLSIPSATKVCCNFPETISHIPDGKAVLTGSPIRQELLKGNKLKALDFCGFTADKPVLLVIGGSQGSVIVNDSIRELLALRKPNLLIPLSANASRGDQILNAESFERQGFSMVLSEEELAPSLLLPAIQKLYDHRSDYIAAMDKSQQGDAISTIIHLIEDASL